MRLNPACLASSVALLLPLAAAGQAERSLVLSEEARKNLGIELAAAAQQDLHDVLDVRGMMREQADRVAWVSPAAKGRIVEVLAREADEVREGQVLVRLHCTELETLRTELATGTERAAMLEAEVERVRQLVEDGVLARRDLLRAETEHRLARSRADAARRGILLLGMTEEELQGLLEDPALPAYLPLHAPIGGHVTAREAYQGEMVEPGRRLLKIMDVSVLWAEGDIFERDVPRVAEGQQVSLALRSFKDWTFQGTIRAMSADLDPQKRTAHLWIEVQNPEGRLKPQMAVDMSILLERRARVLAVPREAVLQDQGESFVFVVNGDAFLRHAVVTGMKDHRWCEIREGLYEGDQVVVRGNHELRLALSADTPPLGSDGHLHTH